jgi:hypothetical protein
MGDEENSRGGVREGSCLQRMRCNYSFWRDSPMAFQFINISVVAVFFVVWIFVFRIVPDHC